MAGLLILLSVIEVVFNKTKHRHDWMFGTVLIGMLGSTLLTSYIGNAFAIQAQPWHKAQNYIPTLGMLIGNSMSGVAVGLNSAMTQLVDQQERIQMYLSFGASRWEAARPVCVEAIKLALLPTINTMSIVGLISIPGMMSGQILGGAPIPDAVRYQQIINFMITASVGIATVITVLLCVFITFDESARLRLDRIKKDIKKKKKGNGQPAGSHQGVGWWGGVKERVAGLRRRNRNGSDEERRSLLRH
ncbi:hypothetical protein HDV00_008445 [Rhizophlyctis rosea]|nr:hypothetical protein HDV00_008445 [Rhizophlyctis rosea]